MEFFEVLNRRRSVRKYTDANVPDDIVNKALDAALLAPNSSNMQPWEFYWVRSPEQKAALVNACFGQGAAKTAQHLVVAVCRADTWRRNQKLMLQALAAEATPAGPASRLAYYKKVVPLVYLQDPLGLLAAAKRVAFFVAGLFRPVPRSPCSRGQLFQMLHKTTGLACENFMLAITAQGFATCPMEGFDEVRVKKILNLGRHAAVTMVISVGQPDPRGIWGDRLRFDRGLFVKTV